MPQLAELAAWMVEQPVRQVPVVRRWGRLRADLPFRENAPVPIPSRVFRLHWRDLDPYMQVDDIGWDQDRLVVTGRANVPSIDIPRRRNTSKIVVLRRPARDPAAPGRAARPVVLPPGGHGAVRAGQVQLRLVGFPVRGQPAAVPRDRGVAVLHARPRARRLAPGPGAHPGARPRGAAAAASGGARPAVRRPLGRSRPERGGVAARRGRGRRGLAGRRLPGRCGSTWSCPRRRPALLRPALLRPDLFRPPPTPAELVLVRNRGAATRSFPAAPAESSPGGPARFSALVPLSDLAGAADVVDRVEGSSRVAGDDGMAWDVYLKQPGRPRVRVAWPDGTRETRHLFGAREALAGQSRYGDLVIAERAPRPVIDEHEWRPGGRLVLRGSFLGAGRPGAGPAPAEPVRDAAAPDRVRRLARHRLRRGRRAVQHRGRPGPDAVLRLGHPAAGRRMEPVRPPGGRRTRDAGRDHVRPRPAGRRHRPAGSRPAASSTGWWSPATTTR